MSVKRIFKLYVNEELIGTKSCAWPMLRILAQLHKRYPDAKSLGVRLCEEDWLEILAG